MRAARDRSGAATDVHWEAHLWARLLLVCGVVFVDAMDLSVIGVALPTMQADLGLSPSQLQWTVSGYALGYGGLLLLGGRICDLFGRRRVLVAGLGVFAVASFFGGIVSDPTLLFVARFVKGMSAAFTAPAGLSIIATTFPEGPSRNKALSIFSAFAASGFSFGLVIGGLVTGLGWRWTFLLAVPLSLALLVATRRVIARDAPPVRGRFDVAGAVTITAALLLLVRSVVRAPEIGWGAAGTLAGFVAVLGLLALFVLIERRTAQPLVRLGMLRSAQLVRTSLGAMIGFGGYAAFQFVTTLFLQSALGWSALQTAFAFLPTGAFMALGWSRAGTLVSRYGSAPVLLVAFVTLAAAYALFLPVDTTPHYVTAVLPTMTLIGIGFALMSPALSIQATTGVEDDEQGLASGLLQTAFQVGAAIMIAVVSALLSSGASEITNSGAFLDALHPAIAVITCVTALGAVIALLGVLGGTRLAGPASATADAP